MFDEQMLGLPANEATDTSVKLGLSRGLTHRRAYEIILTTRKQSLAFSITPPLLTPGNIFAYHFLGKK